MTIQQRNLVEALKAGMISWFEYFERWRKLDEKKSEDLDSWIKDHFEDFVLWLSENGIHKDRACDYEQIFFNEWNRKEAA